jgi:WD40 repeat protein
VVVVVVVVGSTCVGSGTHAHLLTTCACRSQYDSDTNQMLSGSDDKTVKIFDVRTGVCTGSIPASGAVGNLQCQGNVLMTVLKRENDVFWYDLRNGNLVRQLSGHEKAVCAVLSVRVSVRVSVLTHCYTLDRCIVCNSIWHKSDWSLARVIA